MADKKKAQVWYMDMVLGLTIFTLISILAFKYISERQSLEDTNNAPAEAQRISEFLMSEGIPQNWTAEDVRAIGIISSGNEINLTKLGYLANLTASDYYNVKSVFGIKSDFIIYFENLDGALINVTGQPYIGMENFTDEIVELSDAGHVSVITRYIVYRHDSIAEIISMKVETWQEK